MRLTSLHSCCSQPHRGAHHSPDLCLRWAARSGNVPTALSSLSRALSPLPVTFLPFLSPPNLLLFAFSPSSNSERPSLAVRAIQFQLDRMNSEYMCSLAPPLVRWLSLPFFPASLSAAETCPDIGRNPKMRFFVGESKGKHQPRPNQSKNGSGSQPMILKV